MVTDGLMRWTLMLCLLVGACQPLLVGAAQSSAQMLAAGDGWSTQAVRRAMAEIKARHGGSMLRQQSSRNTLLVQWKTSQGVQVFVIEPETGRWYPAARRDARPGR